MDIHKTFDIKYIKNFVLSHGLKADVIDEMVCFSPTLNDCDETTIDFYLQNYRTVHIGMMMHGQWTSKIFSKLDDNVFKLTHFLAYVPNDGINHSYGHFGLMPETPLDKVESIYKQFF